jgi:Protein of unknown function (DUF3606)
MPDNKNAAEGRDRSQIAAGQAHEVEHIAERYGISIEQARELITKHGNNREKLELEVSRLKG